MNDLLLRACRGESTPRTPVWIMRQAGRVLPEYRAIRAKYEFLEVCRTPELAAQVTLQPVEILGVDAAILFADILLPLAALGVEVQFVEGQGPVIAQPVRSRDAIQNLRRRDVETELGFVTQAIHLLREELQERVPLIGFAGTPWSVASYLVEGGTSRHHPHLLAWSWEDADGLEELLMCLGDLTREYLALQVEAGAQVLQLFDTWAGLLAAKRWRRVARPALDLALEDVKGRVPIIYYVNGGAHLLEEIADLPVEVISLDWRVPLQQAQERLPEKVLQGNLDPTALLSPPERVQQLVRELLQETTGPHILNLGHGILPQTSVESAQAFVAAARHPVATA